MLVSGTPANCLEDTLELRFDGIDDYVQVAPDTFFDFGVNQDFTIECRVRTTHAADVAIVGNKDWDLGINTGFVFSFRFANGPEWKVNIADGTNRAGINVGGPIADNEWHTLSVSFDRDGLVKMYEDGQFLASENISSIGDITTNQGLFFGADNDQAYPYEGAIAEVRVWDTLIGSQEIDNWACSRVSGTHPNWNHLIGYWKMNEATGTTVLDQINANHGTVVGPNWSEYDSLFVYDYSNTPRLPDVAVTALTHLCIPIDPDWGLDGISWVDTCALVGLPEISSANPTQLTLYPNPAMEKLNLEIENKTLPGETLLKIFDSMGKAVKEESVYARENVIDISALANGIYWVSVTQEGRLLASKMIIKQ